MRILVVEYTLLPLPDNYVVEMGLAVVNRRSKSQFEWSQPEHNSIIIRPPEKSPWKSMITHSFINQTGLTVELLEGGIEYKDYRKHQPDFDIRSTWYWGRGAELLVRPLVQAKYGAPELETVDEALELLAMRPMGRMGKAPDRALNVARILSTILEENTRGN